MIYFKVLKYPFFIFEVNLKYFVGGSKRYLASNFNIDFLSLKKCRLSRKRTLADEMLIIHYNHKALKSQRVLFSHYIKPSNN